jgi:beta,beta-carotene 9',10'-dioxygenase
MLGSASIQAEGEEPMTTATAVGTRRRGFETLEEEIRVERLPTRGEIPPWLSGTLMRVTPAMLDVGGKPAGHWFDGLAMLNAFTFSDGTVGYANRYLDTKERRGALSGRRSQFAYAATDPCQRFGRRMVALFDQETFGLHNVNVAKLGHRHLSLTESACAVEFDRQTLATMGYVRIGRGTEFQGPLAHMHYDRDSGSAIAFMVRFGIRNEYRLFSLAPDSLERRPIASIPAPREPHYMHSFAMTERFLILIEIPMAYSLVGLLRTGKFMDAFRWHPEQGTRYIVVDRVSGELIAERFGDPFYCWHQINAFDDGQEIVIDLVAMNDPDFIYGLDVTELRTIGHTADFCGEARRLRVPLKPGRVTQQPLAEARVEFPQINYSAHNARDYQYAYAPAYARADSDWFDELLKIDVTTGRLLRWSQDGCYPGEAIIVPTPDSSAEDDAIALNVVLDSHTGRSFLLILDAGSFEEIGRAELPHHIPFNFHQQYFR